MSRKDITTDLGFAQSIIATLRHPLVVLDEDLRIVLANRSFYFAFKVSEEQTVGQLIYDLGNGQWNIPALRELLSTILPEKASIESFLIDHKFPAIGRRIMLVNARQLRRKPDERKMIFLAIEDITERRKAEEDLNRALEDSAQRAETLEVANEELAVSNEEIESTNEELRVSNEEHIKEAELRRQAEDALRLAYEREHYISEVLQKAMIPAEPTIAEGYRVAAAYIPVSEYSGVGGDFYDVFPLQKNRVGILIGDVSGKGVEAASLAASTRNIIRALSYLSNSPGEVLGRANDALVAQGTHGLFVTAHLDFLHISNGRVRSVSAGHPPPAVLRANKSVEFISKPNLPLGVERRLIYEESSYSLNSGDGVVLYTDGVDEARIAGDFFGYEGIERVLRKCVGKPPEYIRDKLLSAINEWSGGNLRDDVAIIVIQRER